MTVTRFLFHTAFGERLLLWLEQRAGLCIVQADWLAMQRCNEPKAVSEAQ